MQLEVKLDTRQFDHCTQLTDTSSWLLVVRDGVFRMREQNKRQREMLECGCKSEDMRPL